MKLRKTKGFTLIELMIVVAIIGILAAIAIPKFADLIRKSKEGATKGNLGSLRSAVTVYYAENEFYAPTSAAGNTTTDNIDHLTPKYIEAIPTVKLALPQGTHTDTANIVALNAPDYQAVHGGAFSEARWAYCSANGTMLIECAHTDTKSQVISTW